MDSNLAHLPDPGRVLAAALVSAGKELGLTQADARCGDRAGPHGA